MLPQLAKNTILRDRYKIKKIVGKGGMGRVYEAEDLRLPGRFCAVKEIQIDHAAPDKTTKQLQGQFLQEASILAQLDHPNLPKVSDYFTDAGKDYLVMDFVAGDDLSQILKTSLANGELLDEELVLNWAWQLIDAVAYLHSQKPPVLHRDIKPANIKLTPENRIKLVDFGLVKVMATDDVDVQTITVVQGRGTAIYTPLEQYGGESDHTDVKTDIYALGATLYHLFTGQRPPSAKERFLQPSRLKQAQKLNPRLKPSIIDAISWAMEMHPEQRPKDVSNFRQALLGESKRPANNPTIKNESPWLAALSNNRFLIIVLLSLLFLAIFLTLT